MRGTMKCKRLLSILLINVMIIAGFSMVPSDYSNAAPSKYVKSLKTSKSKITLQTGEKKTVNVIVKTKGSANKKIKVSLSKSDKKIVKIKVGKASKKGITKLTITAKDLNEKKIAKIKVTTLGTNKKKKKLTKTIKVIVEPEEIEESEQDDSNENSTEEESMKESTEEESTKESTEEESEKENIEEESTKEDTEEESTKEGTDGSTTQEATTEEKTTEEMDGENDQEEESHEHVMKQISAKEKTCTQDGNIAYWQCTTCQKIYTDVLGTKEMTYEETIVRTTGHTTVKDVAVSPTHTSTGLTEGSHCSVCQEVIVKQEVIPVLDENQYAITYHICSDDNYLQSLEIENTNPTYYTSEGGLKLQNIKAAGYIFEGWYDGEGENAALVKEVKQGEKGDIELYAHWSLREYTIQFDSPLMPVDTIKYKVNEGATLTEPELFGYRFMGWSDDNGNIVTRIETGTIGNITLTANWTSHRNQTIPVTKLGSPIIYEDVEQGQYLFVYEIGRIENVPLYTIQDLGNQVGITVEESISKSGTISEQTANTIVNTVSAATTRTSSWTLSKEWNKSLTITKTHSSETGSEQKETVEFVDENAEVNITCDKEGQSVSDTESKKTMWNVSAGVSGKVSADASLKAEIPLEGVDLGVGASSGYEVGGNIGGEYGQDKENSNTATKTWNSENSFENSRKSSESFSASKAISSKISDTYGYGNTQSEGGSESESQMLATSQTDSKEFASSFAYSTETTTTSVKAYSNEKAPKGYYRVVAAGTIHVFAVVGYDIATSSYFVYTHNVLDDTVKDFIDYSKVTSNFDDQENGILPFEVPYFVNEYVDNVINASNGLVVDIETGKIVAYNGTNKDVVVPEYMSVDNGDGTTSVVAISGFESDVFAGNTNIVSVKFGKYVTEIPDNAFKGCTSLKTVTLSSVEKIGANAFAGCVSLEDYHVSSSVKSLGINAFEGVERVSIDAISNEVAEAGIMVGAKQIILNNASEESILENQIINISEMTEYFEFNGSNKTYDGLKIVSDATTTVINGVTIVEDSVPLKISSKELVLNRVTVDTSGFALILSADTTDIGLYGTVKLNSENGNGILCKNVNFTRTNANAVGKLELCGNIYVCGQLEGSNLLTVTDGDIVTVDNENYDKLSQDSLDWVLASEVPENAHILAEKWTYDLTTKIESSEKEVEGYTLYDTTSSWGDYGSWTGWSDAAVSGSDSRQVETRSVVASTNYKTVYHYHRWAASYYGGESGYGGASGNLTNYYTYDTESELEYWKTVAGYNTYKYWNGSTWFPVYGSSPYTTSEVASYNYKTQYRYRDRQLVYTYHFSKTESKESEVEVIETEDISNVQKWVQYVVE